jgi:spermidine synthase
MRGYLYLTAFVCGMASLAAEFCAARLLGNVFGTSNLVWAVIIGLVLAYLTLGYFTGGRLADRAPQPRVLFTLIGIAAFAVGIIPFIAQPVLRAAATAFDGLVLSILFAAFTGVIVLFTVPIVLLGMVSPFAIRLLLDDPSRAGNVAGNVYGVSTVGSVLGAFLPVLVLFPLIGTAKTIFLLSGLLLVIAVIGLLRSASLRAAGVALLGLLALSGMAATTDYSVKKTPGQIYETESGYNYIEVLQDSNGYRYLRLNDGQGVHSQWHLTQLSYGGPWEMFLAGPFFNPAPVAAKDIQRIAIVGLAAGTTARQATAAMGPIPIDGYEIDPKIVQVGRKYFGMTMPNLNVHVTDGRYGLSTSPHTYSLIVVDAYRPPYIPPQLTTREFFQTAYDHLDPSGVLAINVGRAPQDRRLINDLCATLRVVFPSLYVVDIPNTFNSIIYATRQPTSLDNLLTNALALQDDPTAHPLLKEVTVSAYVNQQPIETGGQIYTDDRAPIEWVTNNMIIKFLLSDELETLQ